MTTTQEILFDQENIFIVSETHQYTYVSKSIYGEWEDTCEAGSLTLLNVISGQEEEFTIWCGNAEGNWFYVCLPTGEFENDDEDDEELVVTSIEIFGTGISSFRELSNPARIKATNYFIDGLAKTLKVPVSFREAYRTLRNANQLYLYDTDGALLTDGGMY